MKNKLIICESCMSNGGNLKEKLESSNFLVSIAPREGDLLLEKIKKESPDIVVCDAFMPNKDALSIMRHFSESPKKPSFVVVSSSDNEFLEREIMSNGASYYFLKPFDNESMVLTLNTLTHKNVQGEEIKVKTDGTLEQEITVMIHQIGVPAHIKGYHYLRESIRLCVTDGDMINGVTKQLYPTVAKTYKTTPSRVERAIRHAIEVAWDRGDVDILNSYFGFTIHNGRGKPTNSEFIAMLSDKLRIKQGAASSQKIAWR